MAKPLDWYMARPEHRRIKGISDVRRMPRVGKIRCGIRVKKSKPDQRCKHEQSAMCGYCSYPKDTDTFIVPPEVAKVFGENPKELDIVFPVEEDEEIFPQSLRMYKGPRLFCHGDGRTANRIDEEKGTMSVIECPCEYYNVSCFPRASLMFLMPKVTVKGAYQLDTGSVNNIFTINSSLQYLRFLLGRVAFVPLTLKRVPRSVQTPDGKVVNKALLALEFNGNIHDVARLRQRDMVQQIMADEKLALPPAPEVSDEEVHDEEDRGETVIVEDTPDTILPETLTPPDVSTEFPLPDEEGELPFAPDEEEEDLFPEEVGEPPSAYDQIANVLRSAKNETALEESFQARVVKNRDLKPMEKFGLQTIYLEQKRALSGGHDKKKRK